MIMTQHLMYFPGGLLLEKWFPKGSTKNNFILEFRFALTDDCFQPLWKFVGHTDLRRGMIIGLFISLSTLCTSIKHCVRGCTTAAMKMINKAIVYIIITGIDAIVCTRHYTHRRKMTDHDPEGL